MKKRICFVVTSLSSGGAERNVSKLANHFSNIGYEVYIIILFSNKVFYDFNKQIKIIDISKPFKHRYFHIFYFSSEIGKIIKKYNINTVVGIGIKYGLISALGILFNRNCKLIIRGTNTYKLSLLSKIGLFFLKHKINKIVCQTKAQANTYKRSLKNKIIIISNPFSKAKTNNINGFNSKRIISVARIETSQKRQDMMINIFSKFLKVYDNFDFYLIGKDNSINFNNTNLLIEQTKKLNISQNVHFLGEVKNVFDYYNDTFAMLVCSKNEGMPNSMIEAMINGVPVISTNWSGIDEIIENEVNGFIFDDKNIDYAFEYLKKIKENKQMYEYISSNSRKVIDKYNEEYIYNIWESII